MALPTKFVLAPFPKACRDNFKTIASNDLSRWNKECWHRSAIELWGFEQVPSVLDCKGIYLMFFWGTRGTTGYEQGDGLTRVSLSMAKMVHFEQ